jgi:hypothetical protein
LLVGDGSFSKCHKLKRHQLEIFFKFDRECLAKLLLTSAHFLRFRCRSAPFLVTLTALCLGIASITSCRFVTSESDSGQGGAAAAFGIFRYGEGSDGVCQTYRHVNAVVVDFNDNKNENVPDAEGLSDAHKVAQAGGILASLVGFTCVALLFLSFFLQRLVSKAVWRIALPILLGFAALTQGLTFAIFGDDECREECVDNPNGGEICNVVTCTFSDGANRSLAAMMLYLFMGIGIIFYPRRTIPLFEFVTDPSEYQHVSTRAGVVDSNKMDIETADSYLYDIKPSQNVSHTVQRTTYPISATPTPPVTSKNTVSIHHTPTTVVKYKPDDDIDPMTDRSSSYNHQHDDPMTDQSSSSMKYSSSDQLPSSAGMYPSGSLLDNSGPGNDDGPLNPPKPRKHKKKKRPSRPRHEEQPDSIANPAPRVEDSMGSI